MTAESSPQVFTDVSVDPFVRGLLHRPANSNGSGLVLTHGAGSNCQAPLLVALAETFANAGFIVLRCDLPYRQDRRRQARPRRPEECPRGPQKSGHRPPLPWRTFLWRTAIEHTVRRACFGRSAGRSGTSRRLTPAFLSAASATQTRPASHPAFFPSAHACSLRPRHARSLRLDRGNRTVVKANSRENQASDGRRRGPRLRIQRQSQAGRTDRKSTCGIPGVFCGLKSLFLRSAYHS
jgi:hypothetical protein